MCGVGGGLVMVPAFVILLGMPQKVAVATSLAVIVPTAISASVGNWRSGLIDKQVLLWTALGAVLTAVFFTAKLKGLNDTTLTKLFAVLAMAMGLKLWFTEPAAEKKSLAPSDPPLTSSDSRD